MSTETMDEINAKTKISMESLMVNGLQIANFRTLMTGVVSGIICGILGLTSLYGLIFYVLSSFITDLSILIFKMKLNVKAYTNSSAVQFFLDGLGHSVMSFILFWTLSFAIVYIY